MYIFLILSVLLLFIRAIYFMTHSEIGEEGANAIRTGTILLILLGICCLSVSVCIFFHYRPAPPGSAILFFLIAGILIFAFSGLRLFQLHKEAASEITVTTLQEVSYHKVGLFMPYYIVSGNSREHAREAFYFRGADQKLAKAFRETNCTTLIIQYYTSNSRIYSVTAANE